MHSKDFQLLMRDKREMSLADFTHILLENETTQFDPISEAFKAYDPRCQGYINKEQLRKVYSILIYCFIHIPLKFIVSLY